MKRTYHKAIVLTCGRGRIVFAFRRLGFLGRLGRSDRGLLHRGLLSLDRGLLSLGNDIGLEVHRTSLNRLLDDDTVQFRLNGSEIVGDVAVGCALAINA